MRQSADSPALFTAAEKAVLGLSPPQALIMSFFMLSLMGALLLKLPIASTQPTTWMQALFTSVSASTVTGLAIVDTGTHFSHFGHWVLIGLMQLGGLGLMTLGLLIIHLTSGRLGLAHHAVLREALNQGGAGDIRPLLFSMVIFTFTMELAGTLLLAIQWVPELGWRRGLFASLFHAVASFNNAGFGLRPDNLMSYVGNPLVKTVISLLFISGGIGFVVISDMVRKRRFREFSLNTKLMLVGTVTINLVAMLVIFCLEYGNPKTLGGMSDLSDQLWAAGFQAAVPRSSGFNSIDIGALTSATSFVMMGLMFIGGGSGSTAGGIKLTTFIVLLLATRAVLMQRDKPVVFGRSIGQEVIYKSLAITVISLFLVITGTFLLTVTEGASFLDLAFEAVSAAGTVGLSRNLTPKLSDAGLGIVMLLMLVGRIGPLTLAFTLATTRGSRIQYPDGQVNVG